MEESDPSGARFRSVRHLPADLVAVLLVTVAVNAAVFAPIVRETPVRVPLALAFVLFVPGYVAVAALFPERGGSARGESEIDDGSRLANVDRGGVDGIDRVGLSVVSSAILVPAIGLVLNATPWGIRLTPVLAATSVVTVALVVVAAQRRWEVPSSRRFRVPYRTWLETGSSTLARSKSGTDLALNALLLVAVVVAAASVGLAVVSTGTGGDVGLDAGGDGGHSELALLDEDGTFLTNESRIADLATESDEPVRLGIENHEGEAITYTVVAIEAALDEDGDALDRTEVDRFEETLDAGDETVAEHEIEPTTDGEVRLSWLLYADDVPDDPSTETADAHVAVTIDDEAEP